ncbi:MAG: PAS domain-containing protein [Acidobacteria bacterium]|nr:PAS domain-containing protein [Acidobacteriota bacterium]
MNAPCWPVSKAQALLEEMPSGIMVMDRDFRIVDHNRAFVDVYGTNVGRPCYQVYKDRGTACPDCPAQQTFDDGRPRVLEETGLDRNGQTIHYLARVVPLRDEAGEITHVAAITTDLTATKRLQREYQTLFEKVPCYVAVLNRDRRVIKANEMFRRTFGEPRGDFCYKLFKGRRTECEDCPADKTFVDGRSHTSRHVGQTRDGSETHYVVSTAPLLQGDGETTHVIEMALDVTEMTALEAQLQHAHVFRQALVENALEAIVVIDEAQKVLLMNKAAETLWGADRRTLIGHKAPKAMLPAALRRQRASTGATVLLPDTTITSLTGEQVPVQLAGMTIFHEGSYLGGAVIALDLRAMKDLEREKLTAERLAAVGQTVAGLAHGIKNVLMGLEGGMYAFQSGMSKGDDERMLQGWEMLQENINRITTFVKEFLEFARGRTPTVHLIDPNEVAAKVVDLFKDKAEMAGIRLAFEPQAGVPPAFMDEEGIHACLVNLVSNALDACETSDKPDPVVTVRTHDHGGALVLEVADTGTGIDYEIRKKVFTTFFSTKGSGKGTGLGLLTTRKIVQQHGGKVSFESTAGSGSVFRLEFPHDRLPRPRETEGALTQTGDEDGTA